MRTWLCGVWLLWMVVTGWAEQTNVHIRFLGRDLKLQPTPIKDRDECWLPLLHASQVGLRLELVEDAEFARLVTGFTEEADEKEPCVPVRFLRLMDANGQFVTVPCVPLRPLMRLAGGAMEWEENSRLIIRSQLRAIGFDENQLRVETTLPCPSVIRYVKNPDRLVIDLTDCQLPPIAVQPEGEHPQVLVVRTGQFDKNTARVVCELKTPLPVKTGTQPGQTEHLVALGASEAQSKVAQALGPPKPVPDQSSTSEIQPTAKPPVKTKPPAVIGKPIVQQTDGTVIVRLPTNGTVKPRLSLSEQSEQVTLDLPGSVLTEVIEQLFEAEDSLLKAIRLIPVESPTGSLVRVVLDLGRPLGVNLLSRQNEVAVTLNIPRNAGGHLKEKIITIDPGHGGGAGGARITKGGKTYWEKDITLSIALKVAQKLSKAGATVIMTRAEDADIGLYERTKMSNESRAHFFISIHCDSNSKPNSTSGTTVYYHRSDPDSRALGQAILSEIIKVSGLPSKGVRSDTMLYQSGLAVLRTSEMPAVLIETGYINHDRDRARLIDPKFQDAVADAIVRGVQHYIGEE